ncbi:hypothetical protein TWF506_007664 [Arthrobotrys conoides]|uniref:Uncharacterized protein n=1 Tax=Arthrobotrys conoides TaxID=74498 RepID=A0AAN8PIB8_9PEZI
MKLNLSLFLGLSFGISIAAYEPIYLQKRACSQNNLYRTLERLQRESSFCQALLLPNPAVTVPSSIAATPIATISSACNCIVATLTTSTTSTTSSASVCANTVTITLDPVTVTERPDPVTVTETYTPTTPPTQAATSYLFDFEKPDRLWGCGSKIETFDRFDVDFSGCGEHEDPGNAHSGDWFYRLVFYSGQSDVVYRFGNKKALNILPNVDYEFSLWYRQFSYSKSICSVTADLGNRGLPDIGGAGVVNSGFAIGPTFRPTTGLAWTRSSFTFKTSYTELGMFFAVFCKCPTGERCGNIYIGFDDITVKPVVPV